MDVISAEFDIDVVGVKAQLIATFGEKAVDVFYVTDLTGKKITSSSRETAIREQLTKVLEAHQDAALASA